MTTAAPSPPQAPMTARTEAPERRRDLDLMRMLVVVGLVFFHSARVFDTGSFYVKNDPTSEAVTTGLFFMALWGMPLLFVIAGTGMWYSLRSRSAGQFARERVRRLLVPLIFGVVVIVPPQVWTRLRGDSGYAESFWEFLPRFFDVEFTIHSFPFVVWGDPATDLFETGHLWFIVILFAYSLLLLPLIGLLRRPSGLAMIDRLADRADRWWVLLLAGIPFAALDAAFGSEEGLAGWSRYSYATFILYGYLLATDRRFRQALHRFRKRNLVLGVALFGVAGLLYGVASNNPGVDPLADFDLASLGLRSIKGVSGWLTLAAILGFAGGFDSRGQGQRLHRRSGAADLHPPSDRDRAAGLLRGAMADPRRCQIPDHQSHVARHNPRDLRHRSPPDAAHPLPVRNEAVQGVDNPIERPARSDAGDDDGNPQDDDKGGAPTQLSWASGSRSRLSRKAVSGWR